MFLENYHYLKNKEIYLLTLLILFSIFIRVPVVFLYGDTGLENEWLILVNNLTNHGILAFDYHDQNLAKYLFPNLYMPPLYAYYIYFFTTFSLEGQNYILTILFSQALLASISVAIFYKISKIFFFRNNKSIYFSFIFFISFACLCMQPNIINIFANFFNYTLSLFFFSIY